MTRAPIAVPVTLGLAAPASAAPPELFVRETPWNTHEPVSDWIPLASAPVTSYVGDYEIGYRVQVAGLHRAAPTVAGVDAGFSSTPFAGDWSAPVPVTIRADFARATGVVKARAARST